MLYSDISVKVSGYPDPFSIQLMDLRGRPDCQIGHFGYNLYFRPRRALNADAFTGYKSQAALKSAVRQCLHANGLVVEYFTS